MRLTGSCHCGAVRFSLDSDAPVPYQRCYCSICRKTQGGGGFAINLGGDASSLRLRGRQHKSVYRARFVHEGEKHKRLSSAERHFCRHCGSALWLFDPRWPQLVHPFASAIDTALPEPPTSTHLMLAYKPSWVAVQARRGDRQFQHYPDESIAEWHRRSKAET
jgi:hypothetical protein